MSYLKDAQARARRRRSPWNLLLIPAIVPPLGFFWWAFAALLEALHTRLYAGQDFRTTPMGIGAVLTGVAPMLAATPLSMALGNAIVRLIGPARRALDGEATGSAGTDFSSAQRQLWRIGLVLIPTGLGLGLLGTLLRWNP